MKVRTLVGILSLSVVGFVGCEEGGGAEGEAPAEGAPAAAPAGEPAAAPAPAPEPAKPEPVPGDACKEITEAAKANDEAKVTGLTTAGSAEALAAEGAKPAVITALGGATCGEAKVEGDKATIPLTVADAKEPKEGTFVKADGAWKFDAAAWLAKYPVEAGGKKGKKAKKAKGKKAK